MTTLGVAKSGDDVEMVVVNKIERDTHKESGRDSGREEKKISKYANQAYLNNFDTALINHYILYTIPSVTK